MPIFDAEQGDNKSLALRSLVPDERWFTDDVVVDVSERDAKEALRGKWIVEMSEVPHMRRDLNQFKAFVSRQVDHYRRAYDRLSQDWPRQCALAGSGNEVEFVDDTGNRRIWPVPTIGLADVAALARDRDQLWGEAVHLYRRDRRWWLTAEVEGFAREIQESFSEEDPLDGPIIEWLDQHCSLKPDGRREATTAARVLVGLGYELKPRAGAVSVVASPADYRRVVRCLKRLGYRRDHHMRVRPNGRHGRREHLWVFRGKT
jgi:predicted P-loop ATPase